MENRIDYIWLNDTSEQIICPSCLKSFPLEDRSDDPDKRYDCPVCRHNFSLNSNKNSNQLPSTTSSRPGITLYPQKEAHTTLNLYSQSSSTLPTGSSSTLFDSLSLKKKHAPETKSSISLSQSTRIHERASPPSPPRIKSPRIEHHQSSHSMLHPHPNNITSHQSSPQKTSYVCERCYTNFFTEGELLLHERIHHGIMLTPVVKNNHALDLNLVEPAETSDIDGFVDDFMTDFEDLFVDSLISMDAEMLSQNEDTQDAMNISQDQNRRQSESEESEESSGEELTPEAIYNRLKISWMDERIAPELLPNDEDVTENAKNLIDAMKQNLAGDKELLYLIAAAYKTQKRVKYILASYFRERTRKIEARPAYYLQKQREKLSEVEIDYAKTLIQLELGHVNDNALNKVPGWRDEPSKILERMAEWGKKNEDMDFVVIKFLKNCTLPEDVDLDEDIRHWETGNQLILRWKYAKNPVEGFYAKLI
ncbi:Oidioi.mRNA.OKI2018_I69.XSR.g14931.t3.cds [Oikopleura dioica]|uniref:Oidioi.mRNA.OKI2018_I69.XSR.g14931.t3.cds n=1 Tax=Oikopleura dioica TaxID=34765 RepID=A0ABN7SD01_OIKDI|nr:Oidioi.mRNA.OKI2018_I69.XSR.g14931.t3.cds [Oikopleura dioica]